MSKYAYSSLSANHIQMLALSVQIAVFRHIPIRQNVVNYYESPNRKLKTFVNILANKSLQII